MSYFVIHAGKSIVCIQLLPHLIFFISLKICIICVRFVFLRLTKYGNRVGELHYQSYEWPKGKDNHGDY